MTLIFLAVLYLFVGFTLTLYLRKKGIPDYLSESWDFTNGKRKYKTWGAHPFKFWRWIFSTLLWPGSALMVIITLAAGLAAFISARDNPIGTFFEWLNELEF